MPCSSSTVPWRGTPAGDEYNAHGWLPDGDLVVTDPAGIEAVTPDGSLQMLISNPTLLVIGILG